MHRMSGAVETISADINQWQVNAYGLATMEQLQVGIVDSIIDRWRKITRNK